ncbi:MAG: MOSC domain-containing protein [Acidobacteria bacterium]|nr:MOSC domain-containing protein [Acidobacteriota bacterium]
MASSERTGTIAGLWRFPVKSMAGERLEHADLSERGLLGDRAYALVDAATGKVASAKSVRLFPNILACQARFVEPPRAGHDLPAVRIVLPDGTAVTSDAGNRDSVLSSYFKREVTLGRTAPESFTIDQYHPDIEGADPAGHRDTVVEAKVGSAFFAEAGMASPVPVGAFFDLFPVSVLTTSTLEQLRAHRPQSSIDERRFRMNVIVETTSPGFVENGWVGRDLAIGATARLHVAMPDPRCVMTTLTQDDLPSDPEILRALVTHNRIQIGDAGQFPCAGVYAVVAAGGLLHTGDPVVV